MSSIKQFQVTFDSADPERLARFWCEVLGYVVPPPPAGFATWDEFNRSQALEDQSSWFACSDPSGAGPRLYFQRVPEGKIGEPRTDGPTHARRHNRLHFDIRVGEENHAEVVTGLIARGATKLWDGRLGPHTWVTMADPEGNEFCVA